MERLRIALVGALVLVIVGAAPALAQRDPFDSVDTSGNNSDSSSDSGGGPFSQPQTGDSSDDTGDTNTDTGDTSGQDDPTQPDTNPVPDNDPEVQPSDDTLPNTGAEPVSWLVMAYALIAVGGGLMIAGRFLHPAFVQRSDIPRRYQPRHSKRRTR
jgi:cytoskeletal protein RodZ